VKTVRSELCHEPLEGEDVWDGDDETAAVVESFRKTNQSLLRLRQMLQKLPSNHDVEARRREGMRLDVTHDLLVQIGMTLQLTSGGVDSRNPRGHGKGEAGGSSASRIENTQRRSVAEHAIDEVLDLSACAWRTRALAHRSAHSYDLPLLPRHIFGPAGAASLGGLEAATA
jgi:hypothetical protein